MKAHIVGGGFGGLAAAGYLIRNAGVPGQDITIYEADERLGGGFFLGGSAQSGYNLPGSVFDKRIPLRFRLCLRRSPPHANPAISVKEEFFTFNEEHPFDDRAHIIDRDGRIVHGPRFGLSWRDGFDLARLALTPEAIAGRAAHRGVLFPAVLLDRILVAAIRRSWGRCRNTARSELRRYLNRIVALVSRHFGHGAHLAHAGQPVPSVHRTAGRLAARARRELPDRRLRPGHRLRGVARPHNRQPARLRTGRRGDLGHRRAGRSRAADHSDRRPPTFRRDR